MTNDVINNNVKNIPLCRADFKPYLLIEDIDTMIEALDIFDLDSAVSIDCEGVRNGHCALLQMQNIHNEVLVFDLVYLDISDMKDGGLVSILESPNIIKLMWDGRKDCEALLHQFDVRVEHVLDLQVAFSSLLAKRRMSTDRLSGYMHAVKIVLGAKSAAFAEFKRVKNIGKPRGNTTFEYWRTRPLSSDLISYSVNDVKHLFKIKSYISENIRLDDIEVIRTSMRRIDKHRDSDVEYKSSRRSAFRDFMIPSY
eukprot:GHVL01038625.1.p1 GENE.GHVL01038625.1~~GHVL01038625.1.p1  ORF type:complete len:254 (+),score=17.44 GHVL01038625.1:826-1587(+)